MEFHVESSALASLPRGLILISAPVMHLPLVAQDEIHHRLRILARQWEVTLTLGHQHRDLPAESRSRKLEWNTHSLSGAGFCGTTIDMSSAWKLAGGLEEPLRL